MKPTIEIEWEKDLNDSNRKNIPLFIFGSNVGILIYSVFDYYSMPDKWALFLIIRLICCTIGTLLWWLNRINKLSAKRTITLFILTCYTYFSYGASVQESLNQLLTWNLSIIVAGLFWPYFLIYVPKSINLALSIYFFASYWIFFFIFSTFSVHTIMVQGGVFFLFGILAAYILNYSKYTVQYSNFKLRHSLLESKKELEAINNDLKESNKIKDKLFSIIAHDLRGPYSAVLHLSKTLVDDYDDFEREEIKKYLGFISSAASSSYALTENLLEWARTQMSTIEPQFESVDFNKTVDDVLLLLSHQSDSKNLHFVNQVGYIPSITADKNMLEFIVRNLISNAIKFTPKSGTITIQAFEKNGKLEVAVKDTGTGMTQDFINNLFRIREDGSRPGTENERGSGLGLILCKEFIEKHNGTIEVKSEIGVGSTFSFAIPINHLKIERDF